MVLHPKKLSQNALLESSHASSSNAQVLARIIDVILTDPGLMSSKAIAADINDYIAARNSFRAEVNS